MYRYEITFINRFDERLTSIREGETIEEVLMAFITANRYSDLKAITGIVEL